MTDFYVKCIECGGGILAQYDTKLCDVCSRKLEEIKKQIAKMNKEDSDLNMELIIKDNYYRN